jgi:osmotically-inducible protein OsmY
MKTVRKALLTMLSACLLMASGCSSFIAAVSDGPIEDDPGKRTFGARLDDDVIQAKARVNIRSADQRLSDARIVVTSYNGIVLLVGQVPSETLAGKAEQIAAQVNRVRHVHNELEVRDNLPFTARTSDRWINTRVRSRLMVSDEVDASRIRVLTENGVVYMMGLVTREEANQAAEIVRTTNGVQKVIRIFEYI